jgi:hypothetical protein
LAVEIEKQSGAEDARTPNAGAQFPTHCTREASGVRASLAPLFPSMIVYCLSYSPLPSRLSTVNPAFFASVTESGLSFLGELNAEKTFRTGFLQAGQLVNGFADSGRLSVNFPPHTTQLPSHSSYS